MGNIMNFTLNKTSITSLEDLSAIINSVRKYRMMAPAFGKRVIEMYRGQGRDCWTLKPNLARKLNDPEQAKEIEKAVVNEFYEFLLNKGITKAIQGKFLPSEHHAQWLLIQQSQHYRIPTRFMDWTMSPEVALFFAVSNLDNDDYDGQFWIYIVPDNERAIDNVESPECHLYTDPFEYNKTIFLNSSGFLSGDYLEQIGERRKTRQHGRFCIQPYSNIFTPLEDQPAHNINLHKVLIPRQVKEKLRNQLAAMKFTNEDLYLIENEEINSIVAELRSKYNI